MPGASRCSVSLSPRAQAEDGRGQWGVALLYGPSYRLGASEDMRAVGQLGPGRISGRLHEVDADSVGAMFKSHANYDVACGVDF